MTAFDSREPETDSATARPSQGHWAQNIPTVPRAYKLLTPAELDIEARWTPPHCKRCGQIVCACDELETYFAAEEAENRTPRREG